MRYIIYIQDQSNLIKSRRGGVGSLRKSRFSKADMNFFKRAITSIMRRPGKTLTLLLLIFILGTMISGAIAARGAINNTEANLRRNMRPLVTFQIDWQIYEEFIDELGIPWEIAEEHYPVVSLTPNIVREIGMLEHVDYFNYSIPIEIQTDTLLEFWLSREDDSMQIEPQLEYLTFRGTSNTELLQIREGVLELVAGREFTEADLTILASTHPIIVSSGFANLNNLMLGSIFEIPVIVNFPPEGNVWDENWELSDESTFAEEVFTFEIIAPFSSNSIIAPATNGIIL